jgi:hypothetical protein
MMIELEGEQHEFPDDATREEIQRALSGYGKAESHILSGAIKKAFEPITSIPAEYQRQVQGGVEQMARGVQQIGGGSPLSGIGNVALGGLNYVTAPINAPMHTIVGKPLEENFGIPAAVSETVGSMLLPIPKGLPRFGRAVEAAPPTTEAIKAAAKAGFERPEVGAMEFHPREVSSWADGVKAQLTEAGIDDNLAPKTWGVLDKLEAVPEGATVTGKNVQSLRRTLGRAASLPDATERAAAERAIDALDAFVQKPPPEAVLAGDPAKVASIWHEARGNYGAAKRAERVGTAVEGAELQAGATHSGQNIDNATRQKIKSILASPKERRGFSGEELRQMKRIITGTFTGDAARYVGNLAGKGGGLGAVIAAGTAGEAGYKVGGLTGAVIGAATPLLGFGFGKLSNAITAREVRKLDELIRSSAPLARQLRGPLEDWSKAAVGVNASKTPRNIARLTLASRNLANNLADADIQVSADDLLRAVYGSSESPADQSTKSDRLTVTVPRRAQSPAEQSQNK